jgi:hypothetical protein
MIIDEWGTMQELPTALAFSQVDHVAVIRVVDLAIPVEGAVEVPCIRCQEPCWRAPSSPTRLKVMCVQCVNQVMENERAKTKIPVKN